MPSIVESGERLVCAVLAAQVAVIRDRVDNGATVDLLWRTADMLTRLSRLVVELSRRRPGPDPGLDEQCAAAVADETELSRSLDAMAFRQAQGQDVARQMADCVVMALERLAAGEAADGAPSGAPLSPSDLAALYVCDDQRQVHDAVTRQFAVEVPPQLPPRPVPKDDDPKGSAP
jgi:hypothetical protein